MMYNRLSSVSLLLTFALGACDCGSPADPVGPSKDGFEEVTAATVSAVGVRPFDVDRQDLNGPDSHAAKYGKTPEIIVQPGYGSIDVLLRSTDETLGPRAFLLNIADYAGTLSLARAFEVPTLGLLMGFVRGDDGSYYYATGTPDPDVTEGYPNEGQHRSNVVRIYHAAADGEILFDVDLDLARETFDADSEPLVRPTVASSARLGYAGGTLALVAGNNTAPDDNGTRHQKAVTTLLDGATGLVTRTSSIWCSHSFDQRYLRDGSDLYELHLGDAYPRSVVVSRISGASASGSFPLFHNKGALGDNNTYTRLGNMERIDMGPGAGGFLALIATERTSATMGTIAGSRDIGLIRLVPGFGAGEEDAAIDSTLGSTFDVVSSGDDVTNRVLFLTDFHGSDPGTRHTERPKLIALGAGRFIVLYEVWTSDGGDEFEGTFAMRIDGAGAIAAGPTRVSDHHLPRGDDAFLYEGDAAWITGDEVDRTLTLHRVSSALAVTETVVP